MLRLKFDLVNLGAYVIGRVKLVELSYVDSPVSPCRFYTQQEQHTDSGTYQKLTLKSSITILNAHLNSFLEGLSLHSSLLSIVAKRFLEMS